jgi:hypothetical protein
MAVAREVQDPIIFLYRCHIDVSESKTPVIVVPEIQ